MLQGSFIDSCKLGRFPIFKSQQFEESLSVQILVDSIEELFKNSASPFSPLTIQSNIVYDMVITTHSHMSEPSGS